MIKSIISYLFLVGIPLGGLLWILDYGDRRLAPPAIAGSWVIEGSLAGCLEAEASELALDQSGRFVQVELGEASGEARLDGDELRASIVEPDGPCTSIEIVGSFDATGERFVGQATGFGCDVCQAVAVQAKRAGE
jgi:hypothetical protein